MPVNISGIFPVNLSQLHDVSIAGPTTGQYLRYNGSMWQNSYLNSDVFNYLQTSLTSTNGVTLDFSIPNNIGISLSNVNSTPGTFGSASNIPVFSVDNQGRITSITTVENSNIAGTDVHAACETSTTTSLPVCTYDNGAAGVGATLTGSVSGTLGSVGGYAGLSVTSRVLVKDQTPQMQNGIYVVTSLGSVSTSWVLTRADDFNGSPTTEVIAGDFTYIQEGTLAGTQWVQISPGTGTHTLPAYDYVIIGVDNVIFSQLSGASSLIAGTGIDISSNVVSNTGVTSLIAGTNINLSASSGVVTISATGTIPTATNIAGGSTGAIPYQTSANTTAMLTPGTGVLVSGATPFYTNTPTLVGTNFSNIPNSALSNSSITIGSTAVSLGTSLTSLSGLTSVSATTFTGSGANLTSIPNSALVGSGSFALGSTAVSLGSTVLNINGLTSVAATTFTGSLNGTASTANALNTANAYTGAVFTASAIPTTGQFNAVSGAGSTWYNSMLRNDGSNVYLLSSASQTTQAAANTASWNSYRPFAWNLSTGAVSIASDGSTTAIGGAATIIGSAQIASLGIGTAASGVTGEIRATNNVTAYYSSDRRLKENIVPISDALSLVSRLSGNRYDWTQSYIDSHGGEDGYFVRKKDVGVIAQEVQEVLPEAVALRADGYLAVNYEKLVPLLIAAIQELQSKVEELTKLR